MRKKAISVNDLVKNYGEKEILKSINFDVYKGETFALLGTNGAGKTTTLECIEGLKNYNSGTIQVDGEFGVQLQSSSLPETMKAKEALMLFSKWNKQKIDYKLIERLGVAPLLQKQYKQMSTGQKRRLHLALALINKPDILFLDEPTAGLDVQGRNALHLEIRKLKEAGKTIIMASHDMAEVEDLCDRIAILNHGEIAFIGTARELTTQMNNQCKVYLKVDKTINIKNLNESKFIDMDKDYYAFDCMDLQNGLQELLDICKANDVRVNDIRIEHASLEQRFMDIANREVA